MIANFGHTLLLDTTPHIHFQSGKNITNKRRLSKAIILRTYPLYFSGFSLPQNMSSTLLLGHDNVITSPWHIYIHILHGGNSIISPPKPPLPTLKTTYPQHLQHLTLILACPIARQSCNKLANAHKAHYRWSVFVCLFISVQSRQYGSRQASVTHLMIGNAGKTLETAKTVHKWARYDTTQSAGKLRCAVGELFPIHMNYNRKGRILALQKRKHRKST